MVKRLWIFFIYCVPAFIAVFYSLYSNFERAQSVAERLDSFIHDLVPEDQLADYVGGDDKAKYLAESLEAYMRLDKLLDSRRGTDQAPPAVVGTNNLWTFFKGLFMPVEGRGYVRQRIESIWWRQSLIISTMTLLPFLLMGGALAFETKDELSDRNPSGITLKDKHKLAGQSVATRFIFAVTILIGWTYVVNPIGRGATLTLAFADQSNILSMNTLPLFIDSRNLISPTACGFLGWYLHMLGYFFKKVYQRDTHSFRMYGLLFRKLLFVYGIGLMITAVPSDEAKVLAFLIGFFPLSALKTLKDLAAKAMNKDNVPSNDEASLMDLPCISRWQAFRLEEEAIEDIPTLASREPWRLRERLPIKNEVIDLWVDAARLISIVGIQRYRSLRKICQTSSNFQMLARDPEFRRQLLEDHQIGNPDEIVVMLQATFSPIHQDETRIG